MGQILFQVATESLVFFGYRKSGLLLFFSIGVIFFLALSPLTNTAVELSFQDFFLRWAINNTQPDPRILLVNVDSESLARVPHRWPWPRTVFSKLISEISQAGASFVLVDILFMHPDKSDGGAGDRELGQALEKFHNIGLVSLLEEIETDNGLTIKHYRSFPEIRKKVALEGFVRSIIDPDGKVRSFVYLDNRLGEKSLVFKVAQQMSSATSAIPQDSEDLVRSFIAFPSPHNPYPSIAAGDVLDGKIAPETFKDKIVILGATAESLHDYHPTLLGVTFGPEIIAATLDTLLKRELRREKSGLPWRVGAMLSAIFAALFLFCSVKSGIILKSLSLWVIAFFTCGTVFIHLNWYIPFAPFSWAFFAAIIGILFLESILNLLKLQTSRVEGEAARAIQQELFPFPTVRSGSYLIRTLNIPCDEVGGDFCDVQKIDETTIFFLLGDVSGHGVSAALVTVMAKTSIEILRQAQLFSVKSFLSHFNELIKNLLKRKRMMTAILGTLDISTHRLHIHHAGHQYPLLIKSDGSSRELEGKSFPIGITKKTIFPEMELSIQPGESLVIYTDGIVESTNWRGENFGYERWNSALRQAIPALSDSDDLTTLLSEVRIHARGKPFSDDVTILTIKRLPETTIVL